MANMIGGIITLAISAVVLANVFIFIVRNNTGCTNTTLSQCWNGGEITMWGLLTLVGIIGLFVGVAQVFGLM